MNNVFKKIEAHIAYLQHRLILLREEFDAADANNATQQVVIATEIAQTAKELESVERLYRKLRG